MERHKELGSYHTFICIKYIYMLAHKGATVTDALHIANIFNDYFSSIAEKIKAKVKSSNKPF